MADITVNLDNLKDAEREQLLALIEKANKPIDNRKPVLNAVYYCILSDGAIRQTYNDVTDIDEKRFAIGNYFRTKEEAEFAIEQLKVIEELKQFASTECGGKDAIYYMSYDTDSNSIHSCVTLENIYTGELRFKTKELADQAIVVVGADRIKKYYFGITD